MSNKLKSSNIKNNKHERNTYSHNKNKLPQKLIPSNLKSAYNMIKPKKDNINGKEYLRELDHDKKLFEDF
jgi:hypothetical protein